MMRLSLRALALAVPAALLLALAAAPASAVQRTVTIYQIQDTTTVGHALPTSTDTVTTTGILTGADTRGSGYGFYIQDAAGGGYSGVLVFTGGVNVYADSGYARGDIIQATGRITEFGNETEIISRSGSAFTGVPVTKKLGTAALPAPIAIADYGLIAETAAYQFAERYEGVRVSIVNGVVRNNQGAGNGQFVVVNNAIPAANDSVRLDGFTLANPEITPPALGVVVTSAQGIGVERTPRGYGIQLRDGADIVVPSPPSLLNAYAISNTAIQLVFDRALELASSQNVANYSRSITLNPIDAATLVGGAGQFVNLTTTTAPQVPGEAEAVTASAVKSSLGVSMTGPATQSFRAGITPIRSVQTNAVEDTSQYVFQQVTVRGRIMARDGQLYYFQEGTAINPSSGMAVFAPITSMTVGDDVTMSGTVLEFGSASQITEYSGLDYQFTNSTGNAKYPPVVVAPGTIGNRIGAEPYSGEAYEAMLVELQNVTVVGDSLNNGQFNVRGAGGVGDTVRVDDTMYRDQYLYSHGADFPSFVPFLRGMVNDAFGEYTVNPRNAADISDQTTGVTPGSGLAAFAIRAIAPTPVSFARGNGANLSFTMPSPGLVSARVFDLAGRLVARPFTDREFAAGPQSVSFDGRSLSGGRLGNGIFFVQLELGNRVATTKLVVTD